MNITGNSTNCLCVTEHLLASELHDSHDCRLKMTVNYRKHPIVADAMDAAHRRDSLVCRPVHQHKPSSGTGHPQRDRSHAAQDNDGTRQHAAFTKRHRKASDALKQAVSASLSICWSALKMTVMVSTVEIKATQQIPQTQNSAASACARWAIANCTRPAQRRQP